MLIEFTVENYRSFKRSVTLSMRAAPLGQLHAHHLVAERDETGLLKSASLYGANASGKTNLLRAMQFMRNWVRDSVKDTQVGEPIPVDRFRLSTETDDAPSRFEILFRLDDTCYRYGFAADPEAIREEWLSQDGDPPVSYFHRSNSGIIIDEPFSEGRALTDKVRPNSLFLSVAAQFNGQVATAIVSWFQRLRFHFDDDLDPTAQLTEILSDPERKEEFLKYVRRADLSIQDIVVDDPPQPPAVPGLDTLMSADVPGGPPPPRILRRRAKLSTILFLHHKFDAHGQAINSPEAFRFRTESAGTRKFVNLLIPILDAIHRRSLLVVDELDTRFHVLLVQAVLDLFNSEENQGAQIVFTTHNTSILSPTFLRPDQIWFTQKDDFGATGLYSLIEYDLSKKDDFSERAYIQGRYGSVPFLRDFRALLGNIKE